MYSSCSNLIIAFHGCDKKAFENVLYRHQEISESTNDYDWLGNGIYFWENNLQRAMEWSKDRGHNPPYVIGAVIDLGYCLDLCDSRNLQLLKLEFELLRLEYALTEKELPKNSMGRSATDLLLRRLDCAVIEHLHETRMEFGEKPFDSVRGVFYEGEPLYENAGFSEKNHIQICVRNPNCIKGYFAPKALNKKYGTI